MTRSGGDAGVVTETALPGIGIRYEFVTQDGERIGVVHHRSGMREVVRYEGDDPDTSHDLLRLGPGTVLELDRKVGEAIDIYVNNRLVARGEVVLVEEKLGVTMTEIIKPERN